MKPKSHFLTFVVEEYFHSSALSSLISPRRWQRFETRIEVNTRYVMDLLDEYDTKATFFVLGWVADEMPELIGEIAARGHEVASKGYSRRALAEMSPDEFRTDVRRAKRAIERATGRDVIGFRVGRGSLQCCDTWALDILAEEGFRYDSSFYPLFRSAAKDPTWRFPYLRRHGDHELLELPLSTFGPDEWLLRVAGGNYLRQFPSIWSKQAFRYWHDNYISPFNMYFHVWEFDQEAPRITGASLLSRLRQYRNLAKVPGLLRYFLQNYRFSSIVNVLDLDATSPSSTYSLAQADGNDPVARVPAARRFAIQDETPDRHRPPTTIVIPCYNERPVLRYLERTLAELKETMGQSYDLSFLFVDDGSTDGTTSELKRLFGNRPKHKIICHAKNQGVAAATLTGIRNAETEIVCAIDADCTYDPQQLQDLLPLLTDSVDLVTASPYHPLGGVMNVPRWRLFLSRGASHLYRLLLRNKLHTYTSCFRVYRKSAVQDIQVSDGHFLGITEILWQLDQTGSQIVESPAVLEVRVLGTSKLKTLRGIASHLKLLARIALRRRPAQAVARFTQPFSSVKHPHEVPHVHSHDHTTPPHATV